MLTKAISSIALLAVWSLVEFALASCSPSPTPALMPFPSLVPITAVPPTVIATPRASGLPMATLTATKLPATAAVSPAPASPTPKSVTLTLRSIQMIDRLIGWALANTETGSKTLILRSMDGGVTWRDVSPEDEVVSGSFFLDSEAAWAWQDETAWRTEDGGQNWAAVGDFGGQPEVWFNDRQHGWKLEAEVWGLSFQQFDILSFSATEDGGQTWKAATPPPGRGIAFLAYPSVETAWAIRASFANSIEAMPNLALPFYVEKTLSGGGTWAASEMPLPAEAVRLQRPQEGEYLGGVGNCSIISPVYSSIAIWKMALACEEGSWLYTSANQGKTWIISAMPAGVDARLQFINPSLGWLFLGGWPRDFQGDLYQSTDGGQTWVLIKRTGWGDVRFSFVDSQTGWVLACHGGDCWGREVVTELVMTTDGGQSWQALTPQFEP